MASSASKLIKSQAAIINVFPKLNYAIKCIIRLQALMANKRILKSGRWDSNPGPLTPHASALAGLRHAPLSEIYYSRLYRLWQVIAS